MIDRVGQQLGNYRLLRLLGRGGFAQVYLGEHIYLKTEAAIKVLQVQLEDDERNDFLAEARTIAHLVHPHIVRILDFGVDGTTPFLVMDYASGGTLRQHYPKGTRLPLETIIPYVKQIASALQYAHSQNLIHRDVKPANMLLGRNDEMLLSDFGIAVVAQNSTSQSTGETVIGTVAYMAPEQIQGKPRPASDQYSLAIVVYEWLCGDRPFRGSFAEIVSQQMTAPPPSLHERVPTISPDAEEAVMVALSKDPKERFASVEAFAYALEQASQGFVKLKIDSHAVPLHPSTPPVVGPPPSELQATVPTPSPVPQATIAESSSPQQLVMAAPSVNIPSKTQSGRQRAKGPETSTTMRDRRGKVRIWSIGGRQILGMVLGTALLGGLILLAQHPRQLPNDTIGFGIGILFIITLLADITLPFFGALFGPWTGLIIGLGGCFLGDFGDVIIGQSHGFHELSWYLGSALIGFLAGLAVRGLVGHLKLVRALTLTIVTIIGTLGVGLGLPLNVPKSGLFELALAIILSLILLPILLQTYKATVTPA